MPDQGGFDAIVQRAIDRFGERNVARETGLANCRKVIRLSANSIRAIHRGDRDAAHNLLAEAAAAHREAAEALAPFPAIQHAGFLHDAQKEYAEAATTVALLSGEPPPSPESLGVEDAAYLNGIGEVVGELRRVVLDRLRAGDIEGCDALLRQMDDIYSLLVTVDFPDAMTGGLRRTTDQARGILEKTRGDLTMAIVVHRATGQVAADSES